MDRSGRLPLCWDERAEAREDLFSPRLASVVRHVVHVSVIAVVATSLVGLYLLIQRTLAPPQSFWLGLSLGVLVTVLAARAVHRRTVRTWRGYQDAAVLAARMTAYADGQRDLLRSQPRPARPATPPGHPRLRDWGMTGPRTPLDDP